MKKVDELLKLVEEGNAVSILSEKNLVKRFNYLLKHDLVKIESDRVCLTEKGKQVQTEGLDAVIEGQKNRKRRHEFLKRKSGRSKRNYMIFVGTVLVFLMSAFYLLVT